MPRNLFISFRFLNLFEYRFSKSFLMIPWISLAFLVISFTFLFFINLGLFPPQFSQVCQGFINLPYLFKEPVFGFFDSLYVFFGLCFTDFWSYFYVCLLVLSLTCSCFSRSLRCSVRSFEIFLCC
jgi:hypothetical protein